MGCCLVLLALWISPRLILFLIWLLTDWTTLVFHTTLYPLLGFLLVPFATLFYLLSAHYNGNQVTDMTVVWTIVGLVLDLSFAGTLHRKRR